MNRGIKIVFAIMLFAAFAFAQQASQKEWKIFQQGIQDYKTGEYQKARKNFSLVISRLGSKSHLLTANYLMLAKTLYKMGEYQKSLEICETFLKKFPESRYRDDIQFVMANNYFRLNRVQTATQIWLSIVEKSDDPRLKKKTFELVKNALRYALDEQGISFIEQQARTPFRKKLVKYIEAERFYEARNAQAALRILEEYKTLPGNFAEIDQKAENLYDFLKNREHNVVRIAVLLPLSGANKDIGKAILDGAQLALSEFNHINQMNIQLVPYDYEGRLVTALQKMKEISRDPSITCVFGPLENEITASCAVIADYEQITLISPTASGKSLRRLSNRLVQLAVPVDIMASKLARFVVDSLNIRRVVTLSPIDDYFLDFTKTFTDYLENNFIEIPAQRWYYPEDRDLTNHFKTLKRVALKLAFQDSVMQADTTVKLSQIDSLYRIYQKEKREQILHSTNRVKIDSADIPVHSIGGILLPVYSEDIAMVASQYAYWNIQAQIIGNSDWYDTDKLNKNKNYINGLIFISDNFLNQENWDYRQFVNKFRQTFHRTPEKYELLGYDNFNFILHAISSDSKKPTRENFLELMKEAPKYEGILRRFNVGEKRYNNATRILKYVYGQLLPLN
ncbi:MAG: ABC transporter substrate-binding protein [Calditrichaeota bacterium]|nr:ABC transporter substrate-binding protein [Calditrichota bacterium]